MQIKLEPDVTPGRHKFQSSVELQNYMAYLKIRGIPYMMRRNKKGAYVVEVLQNAN